MEFEFADPGDEPRIRQLLAGCELPDEDITASHLPPKKSRPASIPPIGPMPLLMSATISTP